LTINGITVDINPDTGAFTHSQALSEGPNTITLTAIDKAGNDASKQIEVRLDMTFPVITMLSPNDGLLTNNTQVLVRGSVDDETAQVTVSGVSVSLTNGIFEVSEYPLETEGINDILIIATDPAKNASQVLVQVTRDTTAPQITLTTPADGAKTSKPQITIAGSIDDPSASVTINGSPVGLTDNHFIREGFSLTLGANIINITAQDPAGNISTLSIQVTYGFPPNTVTVTATINQPPQVSISAPLPGSEAMAGDRIAVRAAALDDSTVVSVAFILRDKDGDKTIGVDTEAPYEITLDIPVAAAGSTVNLMALATDDVGMTRLDSLSAGAVYETKTGNPTLDISTPHTLKTMAPMVNQETAPRTIGLKATDTAGNQTIKEISLNVLQDDLAPQITLKAPSQGLSFLEGGQLLSHRGNQ